VKLYLSRLVLFALLSDAPALCGTVTLYDAAQQPVVPAAYSPQYMAYAAIGGSQSYSAGDTATNFDTTAANFVQGGYTGNLANPDFPTLDRLLGYTTSFSLEILSESHASPGRAGFSVIAISSDVASGVLSSIELGFQDGGIFAQADTPLFAAAESSAFNPIGAGFVDYDLSVSGAGYELFANGASILSGSLRDYSGFAGFPDVYETPSFLFFGDDTTSAQANINLRSVEVTTVPEPSTWTLLALGFVGLAARRRG
jgi:hypothetical protein